VGDEGVEFSAVEGGVLVWLLDEEEGEVEGELE